MVWFPGLLGSLGVLSAKFGVTNVITGIIGATTIYIPAMVVSVPKVIFHIWKAQKNMSFIKECSNITMPSQVQEPWNIETIQQFGIGILFFLLTLYFKQIFVFLVGVIGVRFNWVWVVEIDQNKYLWRLKQCLIAKSCTIWNWSISEIMKRYMDGVTSHYDGEYYLQTDNDGRVTRVQECIDMNLELKGLEHLNVASVFVKTVVSWDVLYLTLIYAIYASGIVPYVWNRLKERTSKFLSKIFVSKKVDLGVTVQQGAK